MQRNLYGCGKITYHVLMQMSFKASFTSNKHFYRISVHILMQSSQKILKMKFTTNRQTLLA